MKQVNVHDFVSSLTTEETNQLLNVIIDALKRVSRNNFLVNSSIALKIGENRIELTTHRQLAMLLDSCMVKLFAENNFIQSNQPLQKYNEENN